MFSENLVNREGQTDIVHRQTNIKLIGLKQALDVTLNNYHRGLLWRVLNLIYEYRGRGVYKVTISVRWLPLSVIQFSLAISGIDRHSLTTSLLIQKKRLLRHLNSYFSDGLVKLKCLALLYIYQNSFDLKTSILRHINSYLGMTSTRPMTW